jgi:DNA repair protein RadC
VRDRAALFEYVRSLSEETHEWLLAFYVDKELNLLSTETVAKGGLDQCPIDFGAILCRGRALGAKGFLLVHNHPSGDPTPSKPDIAITQRLRRCSEEFEMPLLDHFVVAGEQMIQVVHWV